MKPIIILILLNGLTRATNADQPELKNSYAIPFHNEDSILTA